MASARLGKNFSKLKDRRRARPLEQLRSERKRLLLEELEDRRLMAVGPSLVAIIPTSGDFLQNNGTLHVAPRDMTFRFAQGNEIDGTTLANGFIVTSGGPDRILGDTDDQVITPGFIGLGDTPREVVMRFASTLPDDVYSVTLVGATTPLHPTWSPIKDTSGNPYNSGDPNKANTVVNFTLDTGAKIDAIVPQPITRVGNVLQQSEKTIDVYFDQQMNTSDVTSPAFYRLIDASGHTAPGGAPLPDDTDTSLLLKFDGSLTGMDGENPISNTGTSFVNGQVSGAVSVGNPGQISYGQAGNISAAAGTVEFYIQPHTDPAGVSRRLFQVGDSTGGFLNGNAMVLFEDGTNTLRFIQIGDNPTTGAVETTYSTELDYAGSQNWTANSWHHIAMTWDRAAHTMALYVDGVLAQSVAAGSAPSIPAFSPSNIVIGGEVDGTFPSDANYDEFRISTRARSAIEVAADAAAGLTHIEPGGITLPTSVTYSDNATLTINSAGSTILSYNGASGAPITIVNQTTRVSVTNAGTNNTGTFKLTINGSTSGSIPASGATVNSVLSTLNAVPGLAGNVSVTQGPGGAGIVEQFDITFVGALTGRAVSVTFNPSGTGTAGTATNPVVATNLAATSVQSNLNAIAGLGGKVSVTGPSGGPYAIQFLGTLAGQNLTLVANNAPAANVTTSSQMLSLISAGVANLSFNGVSAASPLNIKTGTTGTTATSVTANLSTIPALSGHVSVTGPNGGPFTITLTNVAGAISSLVTTNSATVSLLTNSQTLSLLTPGVTSLAFNGATSTTPLVVATGANGTTLASVQASVNSIPGLSGAATVTGNTGGPFTITYSGAAQSANASLMALLPSTVVASMTQQPKATLTFFNPIQGTGLNTSSTFKLEVGTATTADDKVSTAQHIGNSMVDANGSPAPLSAYIGDNPALTTPNQVNDVDLYRFDLQQGVSNFTVNVSPVVNNEVQTLKLVASGSTTLSFNGTNASSPLTVTTGINGTSVAAVLANLNTIAALNGKVTVGGSAGGPFTITFFGGALLGQNVAQIASSAANVAVTATTLEGGPTLDAAIQIFDATTINEVQTLTVVGTGNTTLSYNGQNAPSALTFTNETQTITVTASGSTRLNFKGTDATSDLNVTLGADNTADIQTNLQTIPALSSAGNITVTRVGATDVYTVTFGNVFAGQNVPQITSSNSVSVGTATTAIGTAPTAAQLQANLNSIPAAAGQAALSGNVTVTGGPATGTPTYTITFGGALGAQNVVPITSSAAGVATTATANNGGPVQVIDATGVGAAESSGAISLPAGTYYVAVSSHGTNYNVNSGVGATGGTTTGAYSIKVTYTDLPATVDDTASFDNSSFDHPTVLGIVGSGGKVVSGVNIGPSPDLTKRYNIQLPGAGDAPGERNIPFQGHTDTVPGQDPDPTSGVETITYNFQTVYGFTSQGQQFFNSITEPQKQRVREALELYSRYLGVQFKEVDGSVARIGSVSDLADMTIATGDPRAIAPTISTGTGNAQNGTNGIAGVDAVVTNSDVTGLQTNVKGTIIGALDTAIPFAASSKSASKIVITSLNHGLRTGAFVQVSGVDGMTSANGVWEVVVLDQDHFYLADNLGNSQGNGTFTDQDTNAQWTLLNISRGVGVVNALVDWGNSEYGGDYFQTAMQQVGRLLGLGDNGEAAALTIMGGGNTPVATAPNAATAEPVFPGDADVVYGQAVHRPESNDIDLYQFVVTEPGLFRGETIAERLPNSSLLNTVLTLYQLNSDGTKTEIAHNDDYYGNDSYLELHLDAGSYFVAVTSVGNTDFDPTIPDTGFGGRTQGTYSLSLSIKPDNATVSMHDATGVAFDGDAENNPGGQYQFWFQANTAANTIYVDKLGATVQLGYTNPATGAFVVDATLASTTNIATALTASANTNPGAKKLVRILGNGGTDNSLSTLSDNSEYQIGYKDVARKNPLTDGGEFRVPANVTVMIDAGADFKMFQSNLNAGTTPGGTLKAGGSIQVLGTPNLPVVFTSYADDSVGGDDDGPTSGPQGGNYGGIVYRNDSDHERDYLSAVNPLNLAMPVFLNYVNHATMTYGGGKVVVDSVEDTYDPIYMETARPSVSYNTIQKSANAGLSANPNAFDDDGLPSTSAGPHSGELVKFDDRRIGPDIHDNIVVNNSLNGLFIRVRTLAGNPIDFVDVPTRWNDTDITHIVTTNVEIAGTPGGSVSPGADRSTTSLTDGRLRIDPGMTVKLSGARIESQISGQFIAEGTQTMPIVFTSVKDDRFGAGGTFDANRDGKSSSPTPGDWGGLVFEAASRGSIAQARIFYGGGSVPIEGGFDNFNAIEVQQADVRIVNSVLQFNAKGDSTTDRNGRGPNAPAVIFVRGAQPVIVNNIIRDNIAPAISINANAMSSAVLGDYGQATGPLNQVGSPGDNYGPLVRGNRLDGNSINGMVVRGGTLTTETIWDDTDITHILQDEIIVPNHQVYSGIRLQSSSTSSLVVKAAGANAGITASGTPLDIADRIGGTVQIIGQPGFPVVMTSLNDCSTAAGFTPDGLPMNDVLSNGCGTANPAAPPFADVIVLVDETGSMLNAQQFTANFIPNLDAALQAKGLGNSAAGGNQFGLVGFGASDPTLEAGHAVLLGPNQQLFGTSQDYANAINNGALVALGINEDGYSALDVMFKNYTPRTNAAKFVILVTDESRTVVNQNVTFASSLSGLQSQGYKLEGILETDIRNAQNQPALAMDSTQNVFQSNGTGGFTITANGTIADRNRFPGQPPDKSVEDYANLAFATGGTVGDIAQISGNPANDLLFTQVLTSAIVTQATGDLPLAGDWRGIKLDPNSNDTNVSEVIESEPGNVGKDVVGSVTGSATTSTFAYDPNAFSIGANAVGRTLKFLDGPAIGLSSVVTAVDTTNHTITLTTELAAAPLVGNHFEVVGGPQDNSRTPESAQFLGSLAPNLKSGDDSRRLGFQVDGSIAFDNPNDVDVYSFNADSGTEVWVDIDRTSYGLDTMLELVNADGDVLARSTDAIPNVTDDVHALTGVITGATNPASPNPIIITSINHGLTPGASIFVSGVLGNTAANGPFQVTVIDANHFSLNGSKGNANYLGGGTWTVLPTDPNLAGSAISFDKDPYNGRDTYSTNQGPSLPSISVPIAPNDIILGPGVTNSYPIIIRTTAPHNLQDGDTVTVSGVTGTTNANGMFKVTVVDATHFALNGTTGNGAYTGGGTWSKIVTTTRDPGMRLVLPNGVNGQPLKNAPFFIRVRSQPKNDVTGKPDFTGENGNTLNPGLTSGAYQLQVRLQQKDQKPGSTIRFADLRYATNAIEVHGLPYHSPLLGETTEADDQANDTFGPTTAQQIGNLLAVDQNTITVGGQLSSATDVDWYQFDLDFDLLQYVNGYTDGFKTWSTIFDIDYADGLARPDTTLSVFDNTGKLILIGRDSNVQDDQGTTTANLSSGTFGKHDAFIGPAQLPAVVPGQKRTYYVAVTSDQMVPSVLDETFATTPTDSNVRLEPVESVARVVDDPIDTYINSITSSSGTAEFPGNQYIDPGVSNQLGQPGSTFIDSTNTQALQANVRPFSLGDVQMFVTNGAQLFNIDPTASLAFASASTDFQTTFVAPGNATVTTDFGTNNLVNVLFSAITPGTAGNNIVLRFTAEDLGGQLPQITTSTINGITFIDIDLDTNQANITAGLASSGSTVNDLQAAIFNTPGVNTLITMQIMSGDGNVDLANNSTIVNQFLQLTGGSNTPGVLKMTFTANFVGSQGNNIRMTFSRTSRAGAGPLITVNGFNAFQHIGILSLEFHVDKLSRPLL